MLTNMLPSTINDVYIMLPLKIALNPLSLTIDSADMQFSL